MLTHDEQTKLYYLEKLDTSQAKRAACDDLLAELRAHQIIKDFMYLTAQRKRYTDEISDCLEALEQYK
jgi:hypothetical protein